jgi:DnaK suppressor protein
MNNKEKKSIEKLINTQISDLKIKIERLTEETKPISPENAIGRVSRMDAINNKSVSEASLKVAQLRLKKLLYIEPKIYDKNFGLCIRCNKEIPIQRLIILPESRKCVNCSD